MSNAGFILDRLLLNQGCRVTIYGRKWGESVRGAAKIRPIESWRRIVVCLAALALMLQGLSLFAQSPTALGPVSASAAPSVHQAMVNCPLHKSSGEAPVHRDDSGGCPMCRTLGFALPGAPVIALAPLTSERLLGILAIPVHAFPPREKARYAAAHPRGPPILV
jgi:hypothetical protein